MMTDTVSGLLLSELISILACGTGPAGTSLAPLSTYDGGPLWSTPVSG